MCVNGGDDDVIGGKSGKVNGSCHRHLLPSLPWSEAAGTSLGERWG